MSGKSFLCVLLAAIVVLLLPTPVLAESPAVTTNGADNVTSASATLQGSLEDFGTADNVTVCFEWGTSASGPYPDATSDQTKNSTGPFSADLNGLIPGTTYYYRAKAVGDGTAYGDEKSFTTLTTPPSVTTVEATGIGLTSATLNGDLDSLGTASSVQVSFEWGLTADYGNTTAPQTMTDNGTFSANIIGLSVGTTYHYRAKTVGNGDPVYGSDMQFTTPPPPSVTTKNASQITINSARLNGDLGNLGSATSVTVSFGWGTNPEANPEAYPYWTDAEVRTSTGAFYFDLSGLMPGTTYYYQAEANGGAWPVYGGEISFTTPPAPPAVNTSAATDIDPASATLNGNLVSMGTASSVTVSFVWGTSTGSYPNETTGQAMTSTGAFSFDLASLTPGAMYYYEAKALGDGTTYGEEKSFTTLLVLPSVTTYGASDVTITSARLKGELTSLGTAMNVTVSFEWGTSSGIYGNETIPAEVMSTTGAFYYDLGSLPADTEFFYRAKAVGDGTVYGDEQTFITGTTPPSVTTNAATNVTTTSATLTGTLDDLGTATSVTVYFLWGTTDGGPYPNTASGQPMGSTGPFSAELNGLAPGTTYCFVARAVGHGSGQGSQMTFATSTILPTVTTGAATDVATTSAILNGILSSLGTVGTVDVSFEWGLTTSYGSVTVSEAKTTTGTFTFSLTGLTAKTTYHFRAKAAGDGTGYGDDETFTTPVSATAPSVTTDSATGMGTSTATLNGDLASLGTAASVSVSFEWGTTSDSYANSTSPQAMTASGTFHFDLSGLSLGTTYYFRAKATGDGTAYGSQASFTTSTPRNQPPNQPSSASPANRAAGVSRTPVLQSSAFSDPDSGDTHTASRWQVSSTAGDYSAALFDSGADAGHLTSIGIPSALLQYSTTYYWRVRYEDNHGTWSPWSVEASFSTAAQPQADFSISSVGSSDGFIVVFFTNMSWGGVSPLTYAWDFENDGTIDATEREPWHRYSTSGTYTVSLTVRDAMGDTDSEVKANCLTILSSSGATVETTDGQVSAEFPSGAVTGAAMVTIGSTTSSGLPGMPKGLTKGDTCFVISALDESGNEIVTLSRPSVVTVEYSEADLAAAGGDPNKLVLAYWDEAAGEWKPLETTVDTDDMTLSVSTKHLSTWAVLAKTTSASKGLPNWAWAPFVGIGAVALVLVLVYLAWFKKPAEQQ